MVCWQGLLCLVCSYRPPPDRGELLVVPPVVLAAVHRVQRGPDQLQPPLELLDLHLDGVHRHLLGARQAHARVLDQPAAVGLGAAEATNEYC